MIDQLAHYEEQRMAARLQVASFNQIDRTLRAGRTAPVEQYLVGEVGDQVLAGLSNNLAQAQQELTRMAARFTPDAPALREQQALVDTQVQAVRNYVLGRRARAQEQLRSLDDMIAKFEDRLKTVPHAEQQLVQLTRNTEVLSKVYSFLLERQQQVAVVKASTISKNHVLDVPEVPYREDSPVLPIRLAAGALAGLLFGVAIVLLERMFARTFQTEEDLRRVLGEIPLFGIIPHREDPPSRRRPKNRLGPPPTPFALDIHSPFAEAFRHLRANLYYSGPSRDDKVIVLTSPSPGDGKTLCTLSLASALVADGKRVLVIEADMHRPSHHLHFRQVPEPGLSNLLTRQVEWKHVVRVVETPAGSFDAITAGAIPPSPAELLSSPQFGVLVSHARRSYDFVLIDAPPFPVVSDALVIAMYGDRVLTVVRPGNTVRRAADDHLSRFWGSLPRYGVVINDVEGRAIQAGYGYDAAARSRSAPVWAAAKEMVPGRQHLGA
jgi:tyrosine-protein kinase Etk/Wzc